MKILCETTGAFQLVDFEMGGAVIRSHRPCVVSQSHFVSAHAAAGRIRVLGNVNDEATDAEFAKYVKESDGDLQLAIESFMASFALDTPSAKDKAPGAEEVKDEKPRGRRKNQQAAE